jgi:hypothetical protein
MVKSRSLKEMLAQKAKDNQNAPKGWRWMALMPLLLFTIAGFVVVPQIRACQRDQDLRENGKPAVAEIVSIRETGNLYNKKPEVEIELRVQPPDAEPFTLDLTKVLELTELAKYVEGSRVDVLYDPAQPDDVVFVGLAKQ